MLGIVFSKIRNIRRREAKYCRAFRRPAVASTAPQAGGFQGPVPRAAPCLVPRLREPARSACGSAFVSLRGSASPPVLLRGLRSPLAPLLRSGAAGLLRLLVKPTLPKTNAQAALVFPRNTIILNSGCLKKSIFGP